MADEEGSDIDDDGDVTRELEKVDERAIDDEDESPTEDTEDVLSVRVSLELSDVD